MNETVIDGTVTLSADDAARTIQQLVTHAQRLERYVEDERSKRQEYIVAAIPSMLRYLRMHGVVLLNVSTDHPDDLRGRVADAAARAALGEAWNLANAPLPLAVIGQIRAATDHGTCRW